MSDLLIDLKCALRQFAKSPGITIVAVLTLAFGIGASTGIFTLAWNVILKSLPVPNPQALVRYEMTNGSTRMGLSGPEFVALRQQQKSCTNLLAWVSGDFLMRDHGTLQRARVQSLTENAFRVLEIQPFLGRSFDERDDPAETSETMPAILSYQFWQQHFRGNRDVLGRSFVLNHHTVTVIGVMPRSFEGLTANFKPMIYIPLSTASHEFLGSPGRFSYFVMGRLKPGMTLAKAAAELKHIEPFIRKEADPDGFYLERTFKSFRIAVTSGRNGVSWVKTTFEKPILILELLVALLLIFCCMNTALIMLSRVSEHRQEYALRIALGAGRGRLARQVIVEAALLTIPGLACGVFLGWGAAKALVSLLGTRGNVNTMNVSPNSHILVFNCVVSVLIVLCASAWPAFRATRVAQAQDLRNVDRLGAAARFGDWLIVLQVAISLCLVSAAALTGAALGGLLTEHSGLHSEGVAISTISSAGLNLDNSGFGRLTSRLITDLQNRAGIEAAGVTSVQPLSGYFSTVQSSRIGNGGNVLSDSHAFQVTVSPGYFKAIGTRLIDGDVSAPASKSDIPHCVLSRSLAESLFPQGHAIGKVVYTSAPSESQAATLAPANRCQVTGMVENAKLVSLRAPAPDAIYDVIRPEWLAMPTITFVARARTGTLALNSLQDAVREVIPGSSLVQYRTLSQLRDSDLGRERLLISLAGAFALLALLLITLGLYGLLMRSVTLRTREIGIRIALGSPRHLIVATILRRAAYAVGLGLLLGIAASLFVTDVTRKLLGDAIGSDLSSIFAGIGLIVIVSIVSAYAPTRRATRVDPMQALRGE